MEKKRIASAAVAAGLSLSMVLTSVPTVALAEGAGTTAQDQQAGTKAAFMVVASANGGAFADGQPTMQLSTDDSGKLEEPPAPTREGYTFAGWSFQASYDDPVDFSKSFARGGVIHAMWTEDASEPAEQATTTFYLKDENGLTIAQEAVTAEKGAALTMPEKVQKYVDAYAEKGYAVTWTGNDTTPIADIATVKAGDFVYVTRQIKKAEPAEQATTTFYLKDENGLTIAQEAVTADKGAALAMPEKVQKYVDAYAEKGYAVTWTGNDTTAIDDIAAVKSGDFVYVTGKLAKAEVPAAYHAVFYANGGAFADGQVIMNTDIDSDGYLSEPVPPTREGYTFVGWSFHSDYVELIDFSKPITGKNVTAFAAWQKNAEKANLTIVATKPDTTEIAYNASQAVGVDGTAAVPEGLAGLFEGYTLTGFMDKGGKTYAADLSDFAMPAEDTVLYAMFEKDAVEEHHALFYANGGAFDGDVETMEVAPRSDGTIPQPKAPTRAGYTFAGWAFHQDGSDPVDFTKPVDKNVTLFAQWTKDGEPAAKATVKFMVTNPETDEVIFDQTVETLAGSKVAFPTGAPAVEGYSLTGWMDQDGNTYQSALSDFLAPEGATTLYALWTKNATPEPEPELVSVTINKTDAEGNVSSTVTTKLESGESLSKLAGLLEHDDIEGYDLAGWRDSRTGDVLPADEVLSQLASSDVTFTTVWKKQAEPTPDPEPEVKFSVFFDLTGPETGEVYDTRQVDFSEAGLVTGIPDMDDRDGYTFVGWKAEDGTVYTAEELAELTVSEQARFTSVWEKEAAGEPGEDTGDGDEEPGDDAEAGDNGEGDEADKSGEDEDGVPATGDVTNTVATAAVGMSGTLTALAGAFLKRRLG